MKGRSRFRHEGNQFVARVFTAGTAVPLLCESGTLSAARLFMSRLKDTIENRGATDQAKPIQGSDVC